MAGCQVIKTIAEGNGHIGELPEPLRFSDIKASLNAQLSEIPCREHDANRVINRIACVTGAGAMIKYLSEALLYRIDLYLTGETSLYVLEYASFHDVNVLIYSHNYTEIFGTQNLARKIAGQLGINEIIQLDEPHY
jgi:putative NIF3 family GTP cyclohydrolase 1 type 2